ncbi:MAG: HEAT repeat domain-containing protein [Thermodesulfobacteriota bacterium]
MKKLFEKYFNIYVHEQRSFFWVVALFFVIFFVTAIFRNYVDAAFLKRYGAEWIPWMLTINALLTFAVFAVTDRLGRRFMEHHLLAGLLGLYGVSVTVVFVSIVRTDAKIVYPILFQLLYLLDSILLVFLWNIAGDIFDTRQGKRVFPMITAGQVLGTTLGSFATKPITVAIGQDPTLLIFGGACLATAVFLAWTGASQVGHVNPKRGSSSKAEGGSKRLWEVPGLMASYPIVRYLVITGLIPNILLPIFFYQFSVIANNTFATQESLISFLGVFRGMTTAVTFVLLFFMGRLYSRMGLTNASLVHPMNFAVLFGSLAAFFNINVACYGQFTVILIQRAIAGPVNKILYNIIPHDLVLWSRTFIRGHVVKIGMLSGSLLMIALKPVLDARYLAYLALGLAGYWVVETLVFRKHYKRILKQVIVEKQIDFDQVEAVRAFDSGGAAMELGPMSVEDRVEEAPVPVGRHIPKIEPDTALTLLDDSDPTTRAEAAASFAETRDMRAVVKLVRCLDDPDDNVRQAAIEALISYKEEVLPFLEVSLVSGSPRVKQGLLEVIRLSGVTEFELIPFLGNELPRAYHNLIALRQVESMNASQGTGLTLLKDHLKELHEERLSLIFYALWVQYADMRLMYAALKSENASIAVELVETSLDTRMTPYLLPLIEDIPADEKIQKGRDLFALVRNETEDRLFNYLIGSDDPITRMLALFAVGEQYCKQSYVPSVQTRLDDEVPFVSEIADYAMRRINGEELPMPDVMEKINKLKGFTIFEGMGIRELHAIASVLTVEHLNPRDIMIREGEENSSIYLIMTGKIKILKGYGTPEQAEKVTVGAGAFLGELSLFTRLPPNATCVAEEPTEAYVLRHSQFQEIMRVYPQIGINLCRFFTMKLRQTSY